MLAPPTIGQNVIALNARDRTIAKAFHDRIAAEYLQRATEHLRAAAALEQPARKVRRAPR
jgi:hypothetical protein